MYLVHLQCTTVEHYSGADVVVFLFLFSLYFPLRASLVCLRHISGDLHFVLVEKRKKKEVQFGMGA